MKKRTPIRRSSSAQAKSKVAPPQTPSAKSSKAAAADTKLGLKISDTASGGGPPRLPLSGPRVTADNIAEFLKPATPPPGVVPKDAPTMAMDSFPCSADGFGPWAASSFQNAAFTEGWTFMGYPYLSQLALIAEYRLLVGTIAEDATRKWIEIQSVSDEADKETGGSGGKQSDKIKELTDEMDRLGVRDAFKLISEQDGFFGRAHLYIDTGDTDNPAELKMPMGDGGDLTEKKFKPGFLKAFKTVEPVWCYPSRYDAADPLKDGWYNPSVWYVNGKEVHQDRLLLFIGRPVSDLLKPAFSFGGLSLSQMAKPYIDNWLQTRQSVNDLIQAFSTMVLSTNMSTVMQGGASEDLDARLRMFNNFRNNRGVMALDKDTEELTNVSVPLGTLDHLQAQAQEHICSVGQQPLVKYTGITPSGLNASSDGEIRVWYDREHAYQEYFFGPKLDIVFKLVQINLWGKVDPDLMYIFKPLMELSEVELATLKKTEMETDAIGIDKGVLHPRESRQRIASDPDAPYGAIDVDDEPETQEPEPGNIRERVDEGEEGEEEGAQPGNLKAAA